MGLQPILKIVEAGVVRDLAGHQAAGEVRDSIRKGVPDAVVFLCRGFWRRLDQMVLFDEGVQSNHLRMKVQSFQDGGSRDASRQRRQGCEDCSLGHCDER